MKNIILFSALLIVSSTVIESCSVNKAADQKGPLPTQVSTTNVKTGSAIYYDEYPATVVALNQVDLRPQVSGYITDIFVQDGQQVSKGLRLFAIDQQQYQAAYDQVRANLNVAKANLAKAQEDADRYQDLSKNDAVARQTLEHSINDLESAKMQVAAVEASLKSAETNLQYSIILAPFDGTIGISQVKRGSSVITGQTILNTISSDDPIAVDCAVDEKQIGRFNTLLRSATNGKDSTFTIILPDQSLYPYPGKLSFLDRSVDFQTGTIRVRVIFPDSKKNLKPGLTCDLRVRAASSSATMLIPYKAVTEQMGEYFVFTVKENKATQRRVSLGMNINDMVIVNNGLQPGEQIVTDGMQRLRDNSMVLVMHTGPSPLVENAQNK
jgi:membrane fusion protein (multidrug efflux system)